VEILAQGPASLTLACSGRWRFFAEPSGSTAAAALTTSVRAACLDPFEVQELAPHMALSHVDVLEGHPSGRRLSNLRTRWFSSAAQTVS
jgi:hypothetical protein